jgi:hypothetical protein
MRRRNGRLPWFVGRQIALELARLISENLQVSRILCPYFRVLETRPLSEGGKGGRPDPRVREARGRLGITPPGGASLALWDPGQRRTPSLRYKERQGRGHGGQLSSFCTLRAAQAHWT